MYNGLPIYELQSSDWCLFYVSSWIWDFHMICEVIEFFGAKLTEPVIVTQIYPSMSLWFTSTCSTCTESRQWALILHTGQTLVISTLFYPSWKTIYNLRTNDYYATEQILHPLIQKDVNCVGIYHIITTTINEIWEYITWDYIFILFNGAPTGEKMPQLGKLASYENSETN